MARHYIPSTSIGPSGKGSRSLDQNLIDRLLGLFPAARDSQGSALPPARMQAAGEAGLEASWITTSNFIFSKLLINLRTLQDFAAGTNMFSGKVGHGNAKPGSLSL